MAKQPMRTSNGPDPLDAEIGARLRRFRLDQGMTLKELGKVLNLSGQQIQKYEVGASRLSCAMLVRLMQHHDASPALFLRGITSAEHQVSPLELTPDEAELLRFYRRFKTDKLKIAALNLFRSIAEKG